MLKRALWVAIGAGFGFGMSVWTMRAVRRTADKHLPASVIERIERALDALEGTSRPRLAVGAAGRLGPVFRESQGMIRARVAGHPAAAGLRALAGGLAGGSAGGSAGGTGGGSGRVDD